MTKTTTAVGGCMYIYICMCIYIYMYVYIWLKGPVAAISAQGSLLTSW